MEMKNITIVLQRSELNYLINYDSLRISTDRIINYSYDEFKLLSEKNKVHLLQNSLPIYERDHEVLLIEYNSKLVFYDNSPSLEFKGILSIIPLTDIGARLLSSKLNTDFNFLSPIDSKTYKAFTTNRNHILRLEAGKKLCTLYDVPMPSDVFIADFNKATSFQLDNIKPNKTDSTLAHLVDFNITPSFIPEGNVEALIKSACVGMRKVDMEVEKITQSAFYTFVILEKEGINSKTLFQAIKHIEAKIELDIEGKEKFVKLTKTLTDNGKYKNAFLLFSYFYYLKKVIEKNDYDVSVPKDDILELKYYDSDIASMVLLMLGYTFSIQTISKSIQSFSKSELLKNPKNLDLEWTPKVIEQKNKERQFEKDNAKFEYNENNLLKNQIESSFEDEEAIEIQPPLEDLPEETTSNVVSKMNNDLELTNMDLGLFPIEKELSNEVEIVSIFNLAEFKKNIGGGERAKKLSEALKDRNIDEKDVSKEIVISCLKEISLYDNNKGKVYDFARKALKIFK
jgi:hypothetical protein